MFVIIEWECESRSWENSSDCSSIQKRLYDCVRNKLEGEMHWKP